MKLSPTFLLLALCGLTLVLSTPLYPIKIAEEAAEGSARELAGSSSNAVDDLTNDLARLRMVSTRPKQNSGRDSLEHAIPPTPRRKQTKGVENAWWERPNAGRRGREETEQKTETQAPSGSRKRY